MLTICRHALGALLVLSPKGCLWSLALEHTLQKSKLDCLIPKLLKRVKNFHWSVSKIVMPCVCRDHIGRPSKKIYIPAFSSLYPIIVLKLFSCKIHNWVSNVTIKLLSIDRQLIEINSLKYQVLCNVILLESLAPPTMHTWYSLPFGNFIVVLMSLWDKYMNRDWLPNRCWEAPVSIIQSVLVNLE